MAKAFSEKAVSIAELAKRNKCSLLDGSTQSIATAFRTMQYDVMLLKSIVVDVGNGCKLYVGSDFKGITPEHNTFKLDLSKHEDRCKLRVLIETAKSNSRYYSLALKDAENRAILMCKDESLGTINEATLDLISKLAKGDKKTIIGYSKVVSSDTLETCRRALIREMAANGIEDEAPSLGVAAILADVIAEYGAGYGFNFRVSGQHISAGLIVPLTFEVNSVNRQYFVSTETANCLKEAIKQNKKTVEIECKTFIEFIEASTFDLTN